MTRLPDLLTAAAADRGVAAETIDRGLLFEPGQGWAYSNPGYMFLKRVAEESAGVPYRALVAERIARPLGLRRTFVAESIDDLAALAPGRSCALSADGASRDVREYYHPGWVSHGVVASTASDLVRFLDGLFRGELLSRRSLAQMTELVDVPRALLQDPRCGRQRAGLVHRRHWRITNVALHFQRSHARLVSSGVGAQSRPDVLQDRGSRERRLGHAPDSTLALMTLTSSNQQ
jgi:hypothetical protein